MIPRLVAALVAVALAVPILPLGSEPAAATPALAFTTTHHNLTSFDGTKIHFTVFQPASATASTQTEVILRSHGWAGSREKDAPENSTVWKLVQAGYGVVTFDARGHGESGGVSRIHDLDYEIKDVQALISHIATLPWVKLDAAGDPRLGGSGGSYGGGWQLLTASVDPRIDVLVPEITWNSLPQSLAPNGAPKTVWIDVLYGAGKARARLHEDIDRWYRDVMLTNEIPPDAYDHLWDNSPGKHAANIRVPTLLVQGVMDTLFNLNEAASTYEGIKANGAPAALVTHVKEHADLPTNPEALRMRGTPEPCGKAIDHALAWYDHYLRGLPGTPASGVAFAMDDGACLRVSGFEAVPRTFQTAADIAIVNGELLLPLDVPSGAQVAGIPKISFVRHGSWCEGVILYASLVAVGSLTRVLDDQVIPWRQESAEVCPQVTTRHVQLDLGGVAATLGPHERLFLRLSHTDPQFATNAERVYRPAVLEEVLVDLPVRLPSP